MCAWGDLNSHVRRHWNLNPARLPIPPQARNRTEFNSLSALSCSYFSEDDSRMPTPLLEQDEQG